MVFLFFDPGFKQLHLDGFLPCSRHFSTALGGIPMWVKERDSILPLLLPSFPTLYFRSGWLFPLHGDGDLKLFFSPILPNECDLVGWGGYSADGLFPLGPGVQTIGLSQSQLGFETALYHFSTRLAGEAALRSGRRLSLLLRCSNWLPVGAFSAIRFVRALKVRLLFGVAGPANAFIMFWFTGGVLTQGRLHEGSSPRVGILLWFTHTPPVGAICLRVVLCYAPSDCSSKSRIWFVRLYASETNFLHG